jgi:hypothetical protein
MQSTGALLNELLQGVLEQQRQSRETRAGGHGEGPGRNAVKAELTTEAEAKIAKAVILMYL